MMVERALTMSENVRAPCRRPLARIIVYSVASLSEREERRRFRYGRKRRPLVGKRRRYSSDKNAN